MPTAASADLEPGTEKSAGPFQDELKARHEWQRLTFRDHCAATERYSICIEPAGASEHVSRRREAAEPSTVRGAEEVSPRRAGVPVELHERSTSAPDCWPGWSGSAVRRGDFRTFRRDARLREAEWRWADPGRPAGPRVEITGPTNAKMVIKRSTGRRSSWPTFEDATAPAWDELVQGQVNLRDYWQGRLASRMPPAASAMPLATTLQC
jgi:malate synthase